MERRSFLSAAVGILGGAIAAGVGWLGGTFVEATSRWPRRTATKWVALCKLGELKEGEPFAATIAFERLEGWYRQHVKRQFYVLKGLDGQPVVLSRRCTHLGCTVNWRPASASFLCPCHGGHFDASGIVVGGPPPRALDLVPHRIAGDVVEVEAA